MFGHASVPWDFVVGSLAGVRVFRAFETTQSVFFFTTSNNRAHHNTRERCATYFPPVGSLDLVHPHFPTARMYTLAGLLLSIGNACALRCRPQRQGSLVASGSVARASYPPPSGSEIFTKVPRPKRLIRRVMFI